MSTPSCPSACVSRRSVLQGMGVAAIAGVVLSACGSGSTDATSSKTTADGAAPGTTLGKVADVPVGGGVVLAGQGIVLTQPVAGEIKAFSTRCTHEGTAVNQVADGFIICPRHGSRFAVADGAPTNDSPAKSPLETKAVTVSNGTITLI